MKKWQYMVSTVTVEALPNLADMLNTTGEDGWDLVGMFDPPESRHERTLIFKRPTPQG
jgi:hypothetical protein